MPKDRFFHPGDFTKNETLLIEGEEARHIRTVMRKSSGDTIELINGRGSLANALIDTTEHKKGLYCTVTEVLTKDKPKLKSTLVQSIIRPQKLELVTEKACELGVTHILFVRSDRSDKSSPKLSRLEHIATGALKQSGRLYLPTFAEVDSLQAALELLEGSALFFGAMDGAAFSKQSASEESLAFFVGPEGGFSDAELKLLKERNALGVNLGPYVLRSETASILACGLMARSS